ncbi:polyphosphate kinase 1 [Longirhabdus pacifica]|uniref:polyphosphate kinase 1 n=1 Tax=Longirhabdus pacifica TaxID=2305227 RepID=UPI00100902B8|nr:polyphosphate kinase 1 [Longirhabdus pacifica]
MDKHVFSASSPYINRDLSWIEFNYRVLEEANEDMNPLLERVKFLAIASNNLDEFMSVRVAETIDRMNAGIDKEDFSGLNPFELYEQLMVRSSQMLREMYETYQGLMSELSDQGMTLITDYDHLDKEQQQEVDHYYREIIFPVLTPMAVDQSRPFPLIHSLELYISVLLQKADGEDQHDPYFVLIQIPSILPRFFPLSKRDKNGNTVFILLEKIIEKHLDSLFGGYTPMCMHCFRITRNADLSLNEEEADDLLDEIEKQLHSRRRGAPIRLEVEAGFHPYPMAILKSELEVDDICYVKGGPLHLGFLMSFASSIKDKQHLRYPAIKPAYPKEFLHVDDLFSVIRKRDVLVHHPYESFDAVHDFIEQAVADPDVLAIKMTMYRVSVHSAIVQALVTAAQEGKQVTVIVELKARFDEAKNIQWAKVLEKAGCHVVYGLIGLKTHAKIMLVVRREGDKLKRYVHVGTGNYNDSTAALYTDIGLFTSNTIVGEDASALFNEVTGYSSLYDWKTFSVAPNDLKPKLIQLIEREMEFAKQGKQARIIVKMNSLSHKDMIDKLYEASEAGVKIDLIIRGVCCLRPGLEKWSENINVISIVDRFLEHSRVFYFHNDGNFDVYLSSADWMTRNLTRRVELMCPIYDPSLKVTFLNMLELNLQDNVKARKLLSSGKYVHIENDLPKLRSQFEQINISTWKK